MSQILLDHIAKEAEIAITNAKSKNKDRPKTPIEWIHDVLDNLDECFLATHVGKYSHSDSKVSVFSDDLDVKNNGYIITEDPKRQFDIVISNSKFSQTGKLLLLEIEDGRSLIFSIVEEKKEILNIFENLKVDTRKLIQDAKNVFNNLDMRAPDFTENRLRQVFFPVNDDYHLLTVLPSSILLHQLKEQLNSTKKQEEYDEERTDGYIKSKVMITFGGAKPQNISIKNSKDHGEYFLLPSLPPKLAKRKYIYPKKNFFNDSVFLHKDSSILGTFHKLRSITTSNAQIRESLKNSIIQVIEVIFSIAKAICKDKIDWLEQENYVNLPISQKRWFKSIYGEYCLELEDIKILSLDFAIWFSFYYEKKIGESAIKFDDNDVNLCAELFMLMLERNGERQ